MMTYQQTLEYLYNSQPVFHLQGTSAYKPGLKNTIMLMAALGNPHNSFRSIHIAGTNGKGSTAHMLAAILQSAGYKTGLYTSPHLVDYRERIRIDGKMIPETGVVEFVDKNKKLLEDISPSFFETTMAMAFWWFNEQKVDIAVVETGLGGRLDSTNIILPCLSIITNIGMDHTEFLGDTLVKIATEKAGIIKPKIPIVIGEAEGEIRRVFIDKAEENGSEIVFAENVSHRTFTGCQLNGAYQMKNINTVLTAVDVLCNSGWPIPEDAVNSGLKNVCDLTGLQGRWQVIVKDNLTYILDTGHNSHGICSYVKDLSDIPDLHIVFGMVSDKDINRSLSLLPHFATYYFTQAQTHRAVPADSLRQIAASVGLYGETYNTVAEAIVAASNRTSCNSTIFIGGSNYVVGEALTFID